MSIHICLNTIPITILNKYKYSSVRCIKIEFPIYVYLDEDAANRRFPNHATHYALLDLTKEDIIYLTLTNMYIEKLVDKSKLSKPAIGHTFFRSLL